ncbi:MAG: 4-hydroxy-tetrahydrodipicolinate synthase [Alistipes sp.]|nr:4-hydroxy-tetrahydrodipicolinate synthase [Candidatus Alistipes equi]
MNNTGKFTGTGVALITPFLENGAIDFPALASIIDRVIDGGSDYIVALGTTSEAPTMDEDEKRKVAAFISEHTAKRVPLVMGVGGNNTKKVCSELRSIDFTGYDAILSVCPYYNKPSQEGLFQHFMAITEESPLPVILYNIPGRTGVNMLPQTVFRLANSTPKIIGIKEASGNLDQIEQIVKLCPKEFCVISGDDALTVRTIMAGGVGVISVLAHLYPMELSSIVRCAIEKKSEEALERLHRLDLITELLFKQGNPVGVKAALSLMGICSQEVRLPLVKASQELSLALKKAIESYVEFGK